MPLHIRRLLVLIAGVVLLLLPLVVRTWVWGYHRRPYSPGDVAALQVAATPIPTPTPIALSQATEPVGRDLRQGPVVVDLAHGNRLARSQFEPLAAALARHGVGLRFWLTDINLLEITNFYDFPDQSDKLAPLLADASALIVVSPFFLWSPQEIALAERFVADGGRLLLISDPDVVGDLAQDINNLAEPFGVVFHDDYLYDTIHNDGNYIHIFLDEFLDQAAELADSTIAFYGARSLGGAIVPQSVSAETTLSSVRLGVNRFATIALAGDPTRGTDGRVLAMTDFDVMTQPYVERHDNRRLVDFVAGFLAGASRENTIVDFPAYLGQEVTLIFGGSAVDAERLQEGARLQHHLDQEGRTLTLGSRSLLSGLTAEELSGADQGPDAEKSKADLPETDLIVLADYGVAEEEMDLLALAGFHLVEEMVTPTVAAPAPATPVVDTIPFTVTATTPISTPVATPVNEAATVTATQGLTLTATPTPTANGTVTPTAPATPAVTPTPQPQLQVYLEQEGDGLRLLAAETVLIFQRELSGGNRLVAVFGQDTAGIRAGVDRLLSGDYSDCVTGPDQAICSFRPKLAVTPDGTITREKAVTKTPTPPAPAAATPVPDGEEGITILLVDDNDQAAADEVSEADLYLQALTQLGYQPDLWSTASQGLLEPADLLGYTWVIWSSGGYANGGPGVPDLDGLLAYISNGGRLTISSRRPFLGMSNQEPSVIVDVVATGEIPELVQGLPSEPIQLPNGLPPVVPLAEDPDSGSNGPAVVLRRGPDSNNAGAPLLLALTDEGEENATGARLLILGMSLTWFPDEYGAQLIQNMATWMLAE
ncbi:hypothetical protein FKZ61_012250 [Litorilinea aerophila]|uniref:Uncharacterized protein n=1 Tax=Litorilinea aerophila TaxID=1204385 RepID=A0A540VF15_9CHLR|nr:hypothetical protein [Litorilinea aerophila]MCC9076877.1 hypothetical protein [Litorilinea aerophila]